MLTMPDHDDSRNFTWTEAPDEHPSSWPRIIAATIVIGLIIGVLVAIVGFIVLRIYG